MEQDYQAEAKRHEQSVHTRDAAKTDEAGKRARKHIDPERLCTRRSDISKSIPNSKCANLTGNFSANLRRFGLRRLRYNLPLVVDCPSNRLNGRLTLQKGFNRALRLSAFMSSSGRQRSYPISPLLPQLAERMLKISLDTSWLIGLEPKALHGLFGQRSDDAIHLAAARPRCLNGQMWCVG
jgi:hypothetical protein